MNIFNFVIKIQLSTKKYLFYFESFIIYRQFVHVNDSFNVY